MIRVSGHLRSADVKPDDESLLCVARSIFSPVLDPQKWEWPETLMIVFVFRRWFVRRRLTLHAAPVVVFCSTLNVKNATFHGSILTEYVP